MMKRLFTLLCIATGSLMSTEAAAQLSDPRMIVTGGSPADGMKQFTISNEGAADANAWGDSIGAPIIEMPVVKVKGSVTDSLGCETLLNGTPPTPSLTGKAALVWRGSCEFSKKAYEAQLAGAELVIIVQNTDLGPVGMGAGAFGAQVSIPVVMISKEDGALMSAALANNQTVNVSFSRWGFNKNNDIGFIPNVITEGPGGLFPKWLLENSNGNPRAYQLMTGAIIGNFGTNNQSNITLKNQVLWQPTGSATPSQVWRDSTTVATFNSADSLMAITSENGYNPHPTTTGKYIMNYSLSSSTTDEIAGDNTISTSFLVSDSIFCRGRWDVVNNRPTYTIGYRFNTATNFVYGPMLHVGNTAQTLQPSKAQFTVSDGSNPAGDLSSYDPAEMYVIKWDDINGDGLVQGLECELKATGSHSFTTSDSSGKFITVELVDPVTSQPINLESGYNYWIAAGLSNDLFLGCDGNYSHYMRAFTQEARTPAARELYAPNFNGTFVEFQTDTANSFPFSGTHDISGAGFISQIGMIPAIALHLSKSLSVREVGIKNATISTYPNPAKDQLSINVALNSKASNVYYSLVNSMGQRVAFVKRGSLTNDQYTFDLSNVAAGNYHILVNADGKISGQKITIVK